MTPPLNPSIPDSPPGILMVFDFRVHGARHRLNDQRRAWGSRAGVERLDKHHAVMTIRSWGAREIAR